MAALCYVYVTRKLKGLNKLRRKHDAKMEATTQQDDKK